MAFKPLPAPLPHPGRAPVKVPTIAVFDRRQAVIAIPRAVLRACGLPDIPGAHFDVLVGTGADAGAVAIIQGSRHKASALGSKNNPPRVALRFSGLSQKGVKFKSTQCEFEAGRRQLIVTLPADFPLAAGVTVEPDHPQNGAGHSAEAAIGAAA